MTPRIPQGCPSLEPCDSLYLSPHPHDVPMSCSARLLAERSRGERVLVVTLFAPPAGGARSDADRWVARLRDVGVQRCSLDLPDARTRNPRYRSFGLLATGWDAVDQECLAQAVRLLSDLGPRSRARQVYIPLALGGHVDHRLACEAGRAAFQGGLGRNLFLYEERPEALVSGAVRMRLGQMGARLPPAAANAAARTGLARFLLRFHLGPSFRGDLGGFGDRLRATATAVRQWRVGRVWQPLKALGPRLQPVLEAAPTDALPAIRGLAATRAPHEALATRYAKQLGARGHAERYWLLLPSRDGDAAEALPAEI
ncbi:MAG TPA: PIG-L family deacetylase [Vicinamibacteria bacterium]|nr:PIG-L family deacetylase [Vicinamibacteria bacterium]